MKDRNTSYHTEQPPVMKARKPPAGLVLIFCDRSETSDDMARASMGLLGEIVELYPHPACGFLDDAVGSGSSRHNSHRSRSDKRSGCSMAIATLPITEEKIN